MRAAVASLRRAVTPDLVRQVAWFGVVGLTATAVHYVTALVLAPLLTPYGGNLAGYLTAVGVSYVGHARLTFRVRPVPGGHRRRLPRFIVVSISAALLSQAMLHAAYQMLGLPASAALAVAVATVPPATFLLARLWVFR